MTEQIDIKKIHPELEPVDKAPSLFSFYGFGLKLFGDRDYSQESQSSIKTLCISLLFIPVFALRAYRVHTQGSQYYFLGKVQVSSSARNASRGFALFALTAVMIGGVSNYISSDEYRNGKILANAEAAFNDGQLGESMSLYTQVFNNSLSHKEKARESIRNIASVNVLKNASSDDLSGVFEQLNSLKKSPLEGGTDDIYKLALTRINDTTATDLHSVHRLLHAARDLNPEGSELDTRDTDLVLAINKTAPDNLDVAIELAQQYYLMQDYTSAKTVLLPVEKKLGATEGARILGQIYVYEDDNQAAYPLLSGYISVHLAKLQKAEQKLNKVQDEIWDSEIDILNSSQAPQSFYDAYDAMSEQEQSTYLNEYIGEKINNSTAYQNSLNEYRNASAIVPVVLDFGILQLRNAENMTSEDARNAELSAAEKTFLSIRSSVGNTDEYRIYLAQVYFWLGKQAEGQQLFDEMLAANSRTPNSLLSVAYVLRSLGKVGLAETLAQEAYENSTQDATRYNAASLMHLLSQSIEEKVKWLKLSDPSSPSVQASLKESSGILAERKGDAETASSFYREAIEHSESLPENATNYNNTALVYFSLHRVSGDMSAYKKGVELMSKAVELRPDESILLSNASSFLTTNALYESLGDTIDYKTLQMQPRISSVAYYYNNSQAFKALRERIDAHKDLRQAIEYLQRSILLSPNNANNYAQLFNIYYFLQDKDGLDDLSNKLAHNQVDLSSANKQTLDYINDVNLSRDFTNKKDRENFYLDLLKSSNVNKQTKGVIHDLLAETYIELVALGEASSASKAVVHAKKAVQNLLSSETQSTLSDALLTLASVQASEKYADYKEIRSNSLKSVTDPYLVTLALNQNSEMATWLKTKTEIKQSMQLEKENQTEYPEKTAISAWALLNADSSGSAKNLQDYLQKSEFRQLVQTVNEQLYPFSGNTSTNKYWLNQILNKPQIQQSELDSLIEQGIKLPVEYLQ